MTIKFRLGLEKHMQYNDMVKKALEPLLISLVGRLQESIEFHETHFNGAVINSILLCGGGANLRGLDAYITNAIGISTKQANPLINIKNKEYITMPDALGFCTAIGLGLKDFYI
jgi:Tfp pilus assembly PilM family ATPase